MTTTPRHTHAHEHDLGLLSNQRAVQRHTHAHEHSLGERARHAPIRLPDDAPIHVDHDAAEEPAGQLFTEDVLTGARVEAADKAAEFREKAGRYGTDERLSRGYREMATTLEKAASGHFPRS